MLTKRIIPCLDIKDGHVVKGTQFKNLKDSGDPVELARKYYTEGADEIVFLDITATLEARQTVKELAKKVAQEIFIPFTIGGGIRTIEDIRTLLESGADKVAVNSAAFRNPALIAQAAREFGSQAIVVAVDVKQINNIPSPRDRRGNKGEVESENWEVFINAGKTPTGFNAIEWIKNLEKLGAGEILLTSMDRDGTKNGYDINLLNIICKEVNIPIIASGGVGELKDLENGINAGTDAVLAASIFHQGKFTIQEVKEYLKSRSIEIR